jgi:hypothetical protein
MDRVFWRHGEQVNPTKHKNCRALAGRDDDEKGAVP